jgi:hypothetical protein
MQVNQMQIRGSFHAFPSLKLTAPHNNPQPHSAGDRIVVDPVGEAQVNLQLKEN